MANVLSNKVSLSAAVELTPGVLAGSPVWNQIEYNSLNDAGANLTKISRNPVSRSRQRQKGSIVDLDSMVKFETDLTNEVARNFFDGFFFSSLRGGVAAFAPTAVTGTSFTVASGGALAAGTLIWCTGFNIAANNGLKVVGASSTATAINVTGLTVETVTAAQNATVEVCGVQATAGDVQVNAAGNLTSTTLNFTTLNLIVGQMIFIGDTGAAFQFAALADRGWARVRAVTANLITLDNRQATYVTDAGAAKTIRLFYGRFLSNVAFDDPSVIEKTFQFEIGMPTLGAGSTPMYQYARGNYCNELTINAAVADKLTCSLGFVGLDTPVPTAIRATNAAVAIRPVKKTMFNATSDIGRLRVRAVDEAGLTTDLKSVAMTIKNNVGPEKVIGTLGAKYMNYGNFEVDVDSEIVLAADAVMAAVRNNDTIGFDFGFRNGDGGLYFDIPSGTLGGGALSLPLNESVKLPLPIMAHQDDSLGYSLSCSILPYVPAS